MSNLKLNCRKIIKFASYIFIKQIILSLTSKFNYFSFPYFISKSLSQSNDFMLYNIKIIFFFEIFNLLH